MYKIVKYNADVLSGSVSAEVKMMHHKPQRHCKAASQLAKTSFNSLEWVPGQHYLYLWHDDLPSEGKHDCSKSIEGPENPVSSAARSPAIADIGVPLHC